MEIRTKRARLGKPLLPLIAIAVVSSLYVITDTALPPGVLVIFTLGAALYLPALEVAVVAAVAITVGTVVIVGVPVSSPMAPRLAILLLGNALATVIAQQRSTLRTQHQDLYVSKDVIAALVSADHSHEVTQLLVSSISEMMPSNITAVVKVANDLSTLRIIGTSIKEVEPMLTGGAVYELAKRAISAKKFVVFENSGSLLELIDEEKCRGVGFAAGVVIPLAFGNEKGTCLISLWEESTSIDTVLLEQVHSICATASKVYERDRLFEEQRTIASTLQRSLLQVDELDGPCSVAARYLPAVEELEVGGDWYDVVQLDADHIGLIVGDTVGKGLAASATMSQLRSALSALAMVSDSPSAALERLDHFAGRIDGAVAATMIFVIVELPTGVIRFSSAGHPPPMVIKTDGSWQLLDEEQNWPIAVDTSKTRSEFEIKIAVGDTLVLYTDGLVERHDATIDDGIASAAESAVALRSHPLEQFCDELLTRVLPSGLRRDDVALLAFRLLSKRVQRLSLEFSPLQDELVTMREQVGAWLLSMGVAETINGELLLACTEAVANSIEHSGIIESNSLVSIELAKEATSIFISVTDSGTWDSSSPDEGRGRGISFINSVMDYAYFDLSPSGTTVRMTKHL